MHNLKISEFDEKKLKYATLKTKGKGFFKTYNLNTGYYMKVIKTRDEILEQPNWRILFKMYPDFISEIKGKIYASEKIEIPELVLPCEMSLEGQDPKSYFTVSQNDFIRLRLYLEYSDLASISRVIINLTRIVREANIQRIVLPDLLNSDNILINPKTEKLRLIDYDGMQVGKFQSFSVSEELFDAQITQFKRFYNIDSGLFSNTLDMLSLCLLFLEYTVGFSTSDLQPCDFYRKNNKVVNFRKDSIIKLLERFGLEDSLFADTFYNILFGDSPEYPDIAIEKVLSRYSLKPAGDNMKFVMR